MARSSKLKPSLPPIETQIQLGEIFSSIAILTDRQIYLLSSLKPKKKSRQKSLLQDPVTLNKGSDSTNS